jgi:hypothetical protein
MGMSAMRVFSALLFGASFLAGCAASVPRTVSLRMQGAAGDASVTIDDQYVGALAFVAKRGVAMPPGQHRITVEKAGFFAWDRLVTAREGDPPVKLEVELVKIPD